MGRKPGADLSSMPIVVKNAGAVRVAIANLAESYNRSWRIGHPGYFNPWNTGRPT